MSSQAIAKAVEMSRDAWVFIASADRKGVPHIAAAGRLEHEDRSSVSVMDWFCPGTVENIQHNPLVSVVVWDPKTDIGYQLLGAVKKIEPEMIMDGYSPELEEEEPLPQVERKFTVRVRRVLDFSHAPHSDTVE